MTLRSVLTGAPLASRPDRWTTATPKAVRSLADTPPSIGAGDLVPTNYAVDRAIRDDILASLYAERADLLRKARLGTLSETEATMEAETNKAIDRLQRAKVDQMRMADDRIWERLDNLVDAMNLLPKDTK
jgi:hypothetical protein